MAEDRLGFFIDEDLPPSIAEMLRAKGIRATSVVAEKRQGLSDEEQLRFATAHNFVVVTANVADYLELARQWMARGMNHLGIVFATTKQFPRRNAAAIARALRTFAREETPGQMRNSARFLRAG
jgi:predicted nuclease of predicted toxin-antitoxin system